MSTLIVRDCFNDSGNPVPYDSCLDAMKAFTRSRDKSTQDELWLLEHVPVYTLGQAAKIEHLLPGAKLPVVQSDRGGQITYHGPGQLMIYFLADIARLKLSVRDIVVKLESVIVALLAETGVEASGDREAPGVYVDGAKIASIGLRVSRGKSYHGICLNYDASLEPFEHINPCGFKNLPVVQMRECCAVLPSRKKIVSNLAEIFSREFDYAGSQLSTGIPTLTDCA